MKPISKHAALGVLALALALLEAVPDCADPVPGAVPTGSPTGCLGETFHVLMESHGFHTDRENAPGNLSATGFHRIGLSALTVRGTFVRELREGKPRWVSRSIDWKGHWFDDVVECSSDSCDAGGQMELGPSDGGADSMTPFERNVMKWNCKPVVKTGNCFGYFIVPPIRVPFPRIIGTRETLRSGCCYSSVDPGGTHFSEWVEQRGNEKVTIEANPTDIVPNQSGKFNKKGEWVPTNPDEATSQLTIKATCDGVSLADRQVGVRIDVEPRSGYHDHDGTAKLPRPRGTLAVGKTDAYCGGDTGELPENSDDTSCITVKTNANGEAKVRFKSPLTGSIDWAEYGAYKIGIAGDYRITAKDAQITEVRANTKIRSRVLGLVPLTPTAYLQVDRGDTGDHADGSYGTPGTLKAFEALANDFHDYQVRWNTYLAKCGQPAWKPIVKLSANDIALPYGGTFDVKSNWGGTHQTHNKGEGGDFNRFGAGKDNSGLDLTNTGPDCDGTPIVKQFFYAHILLYLGGQYGHWDCSDLNASQPPGSTSQQGWFNPINYINPNLSRSACENEEFPLFPYFPHRLHLHVED